VSDIEEPEIPAAGEPGQSDPEVPELPIPPLVVGSDIRRLPVVSIESGEDIAEIRDIVYDAEVGAVVGFTLNKRGMLSGRLKEVLATEHVHAIGHQAVMVTGEDRLLDPSDADDAIASPDANRNVIGNDVLTESGSSLGSVVDVVVLAAPGPEGRAGSVVGYEVKMPDGERRYIPLPAQLAVSGAALVVPDATEQYVVADLGELGQAVERFRAQVRDDPGAGASSDSEAGDE
jgi:uncharacterized protein YrrD